MKKKFKLKKIIKEVYSGNESKVIIQNLKDAKRNAKEKGLNWQKGESLVLKFYWESSPQGHNYWSKVNKHLILNSKDYRPWLIASQSDLLEDDWKLTD